ncbi:MAG: radical SAM protein [Lachnospiraceae bacterium]|nr:radical SAM protein [Lachnospiraceae bacterium]
MRLTNEQKVQHMTDLAAYKRRLWRQPQLRNLFLELTMDCNERCLHCGSRCGEVKSELLSVETYKTFLDKIKADFGTKGLQICVTGGEPLLRPEFFEIMGYAHKLGFHWGMTSNGTLIDTETAKKLQECGMGTISISIDGLPETHDWFRQTPGGYAAAMSGVEALISNGSFQHVQITTVVHKKNIGELDALYRIMENVDIDSWRVINLEPMGRAEDMPELLLFPQDYVTLFEFIKEKRRQGEPVQYGCSHYLGVEYEREVRDWYFLCNAGIYTAAIMANGDIGACLDIERRPELIYGNILKDDFTEVWKSGFGAYRRNLSEENETCRTCKDREFCGGGAFHSWDFDKNKQKMCFKGTLF